MTNLQNLVGQNQAVELLQQAVAQKRIAPAYLFSGVAGVGRTLAAQGFSHILLGNHDSEKSFSGEQQRLISLNHPDWLWVEPTYLHQGKRISVAEAATIGLKRKAPPQIRIEQIREISQFLARPPLKAPRSVVVISEAQTMTEAAANALLKTLEEPGKATLILIAPGIDALLPTLVSRCQIIPFHRLSIQDLQQVLLQTGYEEITKEELILDIAQGSPGKAIQAWKQLQAIPTDLLTQTTHLPGDIFELMQLAKEIDGNLDAEGQLWLIDYLQYNYWQQFLNGKLKQPPLEILEQARQALGCYAQPRLVWEVTLLKVSELNTYH